MCRIIKEWTEATYRKSLPADGWLECLSFEEVLPIDNQASVEKHGPAFQK
jgi:hypothetical protein